MSYAVVADDAWSNPTTVSWSFGDGSTATGPAATHTYTIGGSHTVTVTATDAVGNTTVKTATTTVTPLRITAFTLSRKKISVHHKPRATKATVTLTAPAKVTFTFKRTGTTKPIRITKTLKAGTSVVKIKARLTTRLRLEPGRYTLTVVAKNAYGTSNTMKAGLKVVR